MVVKLVGRPDLLDPSLVDHHDPVGHVQGLLLIMSDEDRGDMHLVVQPSQPGSQLLTDVGIERTERLIQQQHAGLDRKRAGQSHPLPLTAGQLSRQPVGELGQVHQLEKLVHSSGDLLARPFPDLQTEADIAGHGEVPESGVVLEHETDVAFLGRQSGGVDSLDLD